MIDRRERAHGYGQYAAEENSKNSTAAPIRLVAAVAIRNRRPITVEHLF